jgi:hypothetical protein
MSAAPALEVVGSISVNPIQVELVLDRADFTYPRNNETVDFGWGRFPVIPALFQWMVAMNRFPGPDEAVAYLMQHCEPMRNISDPGSIATARAKQTRRAQKLYFDFARDMHTLGLLQRCDLLAITRYEKALDLGKNIDFLSTLLTSLCVDEAHYVGIQAAMRMRWSESGDPNHDRREVVKRLRRQRRGVEEWDGLIYWLTNRDRPIDKEIKGCWLFGPGHITDLAETIRDDLKSNDAPVTEIGVQTRIEE